MQLTICKKNITEICLSQITSGILKMYIHNIPRFHVAVHVSVKEAIEYIHSLFFLFLLR